MAERSCRPAVSLPFRGLIVARQGFLRRLDEKAQCVFVRLPVSWLLGFALNMGFAGVYYGQALSPILPAIAGFLHFQSKGWERKTLIQKKGEN